MRVQAIRAGETLYKAGDKSLEADYKLLTRDPDTRVDLQAILTLNLLKVPDIKEVITLAQAANKARGVQEIGGRILQPAGNALGRGGGRGGAVSAEQQALLQQGAGIYSEICVACHGPDGKGTPVDGAPAGTMKAPSRRVSTRPGALQLRRQRGDPRAWRCGRRQYLHRRHGADGHEQRRVDCGGRLVRAGRLWQHRHDRVSR